MDAERESFPEIIDLTSSTEGIDDRLREPINHESPEPLRGGTLGNPDRMETKKKRKRRTQDFRTDGGEEESPLKKRRVKEKDTSLLGSSDPKERARSRKVPTGGKKSKEYDFYFNKDGSPKDWKTEVREYEFGKIDAMVDRASFFHERDVVSVPMTDVQKRRVAARQRVGDVLKRTIDTFFTLENELAKDLWWKSSSVPPPLEPKSTALVEPTEKSKKRIRKTPSKSGYDGNVNAPFVLVDGALSTASFESGVATDVWRFIVDTGFKRCDWTIEDVCNLSSVCKGASGFASLFVWKRVYANSKNFMETWEKSRLPEGLEPDPKATKVSFFVNVPKQHEIENKSWSRIRPRKDNKLKKSIMWCPGCFKMRHLYTRTGFRDVKLRNPPTLRCRKCETIDPGLIINRKTLSPSGVSNNVFTVHKNEVPFYKNTGFTEKIVVGKECDRTGREWKMTFAESLTRNHDTRPYVAYRSLSGTAIWETEWGLPTLRVHNGVAIVKNVVTRRSVVDQVSKKGTGLSKFIVDKLAIKICDHDGNDDNLDAEENARYLKRRKRALKHATDIDFPPVWPPKLKYTKSKSEDRGSSRYEKGGGFPQNVSYNDGFLMLIEHRKHLYVNDFQNTTVEKRVLRPDDHGSVATN